MRAAKFVWATARFPSLLQRNTFRIRTIAPLMYKASASWTGERPPPVLGPGAALRPDNTYDPDDSDALIHKQKPPANKADRKTASFSSQTKSETNAGACKQSISTSSDISLNKFVEHIRAALIAVQFNVVADQLQEALIENIDVPYDLLSEIRSVMLDTYKIDIGNPALVADIASSLCMLGYEFDTESRIQILEIVSSCFRVDAPKQEIEIACRAASHIMDISWSDNAKEFLHSGNVSLLAVLGAARSQNNPAFRELVELLKDTEILHNNYSNLLAGRTVVQSAKYVNTKEAVDLLTVLPNTPEVQEASELLHLCVQHRDANSAHKILNRYENLDDHIEKDWNALAILAQGIGADPELVKNMKLTSPEACRHLLGLCIEDKIHFEFLKSLKLPYIIIGARLDHSMAEDCSRNWITETSMQTDIESLPYYAAASDMLPRLYHAESSRGKLLILSMRNPRNTLAENIVGILLSTNNLPIDSTKKGVEPTLNPLGIAGYAFAHLKEGNDSAAWAVLEQGLPSGLPCEAKQIAYGTLMANIARHYPNLLPRVVEKLSEMSSVGGASHEVVAESRALAVALENASIPVPEELVVRIKNLEVDTNIQRFSNFVTGTILRACNEISIIHGCPAAPAVEHILCCVAQAKLPIRDPAYIKVLSLLSRECDVDYMLDLLAGDCFIDGSKLLLNSKVATLVVHSFAAQGDFNGAVNLMKILRRNRGQPFDTWFYNTVLKCMSTKKHAMKIPEILRMMTQDGNVADIHTYTIIANFYIKTGDNKRAFKIKDVVHKAGLQLTGKFVTAVANAAAQILASKRYPIEDCLSVYEDIVKYDTDIELQVEKPYQYYEMMLRVHCLRVQRAYRKSRVDYGWQGRAAIIEHDGTATFNAMSTFQEMIDSGMKLSLSGYNSVLHVAAMTGDSALASKTWSHMHTSGVQPDSRAYLNVMTAFGYDGNLDEMFDLLNIFRKEFELTMPIITKLITICGVVQDIDRAMEVYDLMLESGLRPDDKMNKVLIHVCKIDPLSVLWNASLDN